MLKKRIKFKDLDGNSIEEDFYFNLNKAELADLELSTPGGLAAYAKIVAANAQQNPAPLMELFNRIIDLSYGVRGEDGRRFRKTPELLQEFKETDAYSEFRWWLFKGGAETISEFFNAVVGQALDGKTLEELAAKQSSEETSKAIKSDPTPTQVRKMTREELKAAFVARAAKQDDRPAWLKEGRKPSLEELEAVPSEILEKYTADIAALAFS